MSVKKLKIFFKVWNKKFDTVRHDEILLKYNSYGFRRPISVIKKFHLPNRKQIVS